MALNIRYVSHDNGNDNNSGEAIGHEWQHLYYAMGHIKTDAGTNQWHIYVKGDSAYTEPDDADHDGLGGTRVLYIDQVGGAQAPNILEGYAEVPGDGGIATLDANPNGLVNCIYHTSSSHYWAFINLNLINASGDGHATTADYLTWQNCRFANNGSYGLDADSYTYIINCLFENNASYGMHANIICEISSCVFRGNVFTHALIDEPHMSFCLFYDKQDISTDIYANHSI
jgi:hypothetical protein